MGKTDNNVKKTIIENEKQVRTQYYHRNPESLIALFEDEIHALGFEFETIGQEISLISENKSSLIPIVIKYYELSKKRRLNNEQNYFLSFFCSKGIDEVIPMLLNDYYQTETEDLTRWYISDCLYKIRSRRFFKEYINIVSNTRFGKNRQMVVLLLGQMKDERAVNVLVELLEDKDVQLQALIALSLYKKEEFRSLFERMLTSNNPTLRLYAKKAIQKLDKLLSRKTQFEK